MQLYVRNDCYDERSQLLPVVERQLILGLADTENEIHNIDKLVVTCVSSHPRLIPHVLYNFQLADEFSHGSRRHSGAMRGSQTGVTTLMQESRGSG